MEVIPAIDIKDGRCVRLVQGDFDQEQVYGEDPVKMAKYWESQGAKRLHVVDLDGAKTGEPCNLNLISDIVSAIEIPVQLGGGIRSLEIMETYLKQGVDRVIVGTLALKNPDLVEKAVKKYGSESIVVGVDAKNGQVAVEGWLETSSRTVEDIILNLKNRGVTTFIYTDISRDGMLSGPDVDGLKKLDQIEDVNIIASGGISSEEDLNQLSEIDIAKAIVGKALYDGELNPDKLWD